MLITNTHVTTLDTVPPYALCLCVGTTASLVLLLYILLAWVLILCAGTCRSSTYSDNFYILSDRNLPYHTGWSINQLLCIVTAWYKWSPYYISENSVRIQLCIYCSLPYFTTAYIKHVSTWVCSKTNKGLNESPCKSLPKVIHQVLFFSQLGTSCRHASSAEYQCFKLGLLILLQSTMGRDETNHLSGPQITNSYFPGHQGNSIINSIANFGWLCRLTCLR